MKLFSDSLPFYRANFHCHTTLSDGRVTPKACMEAYRGAGYDILSITDHRRVTVPEEVPQGLLMVPGIELDYFPGNQAVHIIGLGVPEDICGHWHPEGAPQEGIDLINRMGGLAILAHPAWSLNTPAFLGSVRGAVATEVYNSVSDFPLNCGRGDSSSLIDVACTSYGWLPGFVASDDSHGYGAEFAQGWTMLQCGELTVAGVMEALRQGRFYASRGPRFRQVEVEGDQVRVTCDPVDAICFCSNMPWATGRVVRGENLTEAEYTISQADRYIRVELLRDGRKAWTSPFLTR